MTQRDPDPLDNLDGAAAPLERLEDDEALVAETTAHWEARNPGKSFADLPAQDRDIFLHLQHVFADGFDKREEVLQRVAKSRKLYYEHLCETALVPLFAIFCGDQFWDRVRKVVITAAQLETDPRVKAGFGYKRSLSEISPTTLLHRDPNAIHIYGTILRAGSGDEFVEVPNESGVPVLMANTYRPGPPASAAGASVPQEFLDHMHWMVPNRLEAEWLLDWMAFKYQRPSQYSPLAPFLTGEPGNGKDTILGLFARVVGEHNVAHPAMSTFNGQFEDWLDRPVIMCSEFTFAGEHGREMYDKFKALTGEPDRPYYLNVKSKAFRFTRIQPAFIFTSNADDALKHIPGDDRRLIVVGCSAHPTIRGRGSPRYFERLVRLFSSTDYVARVARFLADRDISHFKPGQPLYGPSRTAALASALSPAARDAFELVTEGPLQNRTLISFAEVQGRLFAGRMDEYHNRAIIAGLKQAGCRHLRQLRRGGKSLTIYSGAVARTGSRKRPFGMSVSDADRLTELSAKRLLAAYDREFLRTVHI